MIYVLERVTRQITEHVIAGRSVRITGDIGSGRSSVLRRVAEFFEGRGHTVFTLRGESSESAGAGLAQLGISSRGARPSDAIDALARDVNTSEGPIIVIDDAHRLDAMSLRALEAVRERLGVIIVCAEGIGVRETAGLRPFWPEVRVRIPPLTLHQAGGLIGGLLNGPVTLPLVAEVVRATGGNMRLITAVVDVGVRAGSIHQISPGWALSGGIDGPELESIIDAQIRSVHGARRVLTWMAAHEAATLQHLETRFGRAIIRELSTRGWVSDTREIGEIGEIGEAGSAGAEIGPTLFLTHLRGHRSRRPGGPSDRASPAAIALNFERATRARIDRLFGLWREEQTSRNAARFVSATAPSPSHHERVIEVLQRTPHGLVASTQDASFLYVHGRWDLRMDNDPAAVRARIAATAFATNGLYTGAEFTLAALAWTSGHGVIPCDPGNLEDTSIAAARSSLFLLRGRITDAHDALREHPEEGDSPLESRHLAPLIRLFAGEPSAARDLALSERERAIASGDRDGYVAAAYIATLALSITENTAEARAIAGTALEIVHPDPGAPPWGEGLTGIFVSLGRRATVTREAAAGGESPLSWLSPLPWAGEVWSLLAAPTLDAERLVGAARELNAEGYSLAAAVFACEALARHGLGPVSAELARILDHTDIPLFRDVRDLLCAAERGLAELTRWVLTLAAPADRTRLVARVLLGIRRGSGAGWTAEEARQFDAAIRKDAVLAPIVLIASAEGLSPREREIGALGGYLGNASIAQQLGINVRTVENHLSRALAKSGARDRQELAALVGNASAA